MSLGLILAIILVIFLLGGFSGRFGGYGYGYGHGGVGIIGTILIIIVNIVGGFVVGFMKGQGDALEWCVGVHGDRVADHAQHRQIGLRVRVSPAMGTAATCRALPRARISAQTAPRSHNG